jgi:glycosyltransferase involved in cell wall biosynthesis
VGVSERVHFVGPDHQEAMGWCASADVFVLNSSYEGMSHVLVEVMSLGAPIVATNIPGSAELLRDGVEGRLVPVGDQRALLGAVRELVNNRGLAEEMGERAIERAHLYDVKSTGKELARALKEVCAS